MSLNIVVARAIQQQDRKGKEYTAYQLDVSRGSKSWSVTRRYRQVNALHKRLKRDFPTTKFNMPGKKLLGKLDPGFIEKRRSQLQDFFAFLVSQKALCDSDELALFLDPTYMPSFQAVEEGAAMKGLLKKKGDITGRFLERYVVLKDRTLYCFVSPSDWEPSATIALANYYKLSLPKHTNEHSKFQFRIVSKYPRISNYTFLAGSLSEMEEWLDALRPVIVGVKEEAVAAIESKPADDNAAPVASGSAGVDDGASDAPPEPAEPPAPQHDDDDLSSNGSR